MANLNNFIQGFNNGFQTTNSILADRRRRQAQAAANQAARDKPKLDRFQREEFARIRLLILKGASPEQFAENLAGFFSDFQDTVAEDKLVKLFQDQQARATQQPTEATQDTGFVAPIRTAPATPSTTRTQSTGERLNDRFNEGDGRFLQLQLEQERQRSNTTPPVTSGGDQSLLGRVGNAIIPTADAGILSEGVRRTFNAVSSLTSDAEVNRNNFIRAVDQEIEGFPAEGIKGVSRDQYRNYLLGVGQQEINDFNPRRRGRDGEVGNLQMLESTFNLLKNGGFFEGQGIENFEDLEDPVLAVRAEILLAKDDISKANKEILTVGDLAFLHNAGLPNFNNRDDTSRSQAVANGTRFANETLEKIDNLVEPAPTPVSETQQALDSFRTDIPQQVSETQQSLSDRFATNNGFSEGQDLVDRLALARARQDAVPPILTGPPEPVLSEPPIVPFNRTVGLQDPNNEPNNIPVETVTTLPRERPRAVDESIEVPQPIDEPEFISKRPVETEAVDITQPLNPTDRFLFGSRTVSGQHILDALKSNNQEIEILQDVFNDGTITRVTNF